MLLSILTFSFALFNLLISIDILNHKARHAFSIITMALSAIPIFLQASIFLGELMRCKEWWLKLIINRFFTALLGDYGKDLLLSISVYSSLTESQFHEKFQRRGRSWSFFILVLFRISRILKWVVFSDPFSGLFQSKYKSTVIWVQERRVEGDNYDDHFNKAHEDLSAHFFTETMTVRESLVTFRKYNVTRDKRGHDYEIDMLFYSSQSNSVAGLFHDKYGPFGFDENDLEGASKMLLVLRILKNDSFFVDSYDSKVDEPALHCTSIQQMVHLVMFSGKLVNYDMVTGAKFGGVKAEFQEVQKVDDKPEDGAISMDVSAAQTVPMFESRRGENVEVVLELQRPSEANGEAIPPAAVPVGDAPPVEIQEGSGGDTVVHTREVKTGVSEVVSNVAMPVHFGSQDQKEPGESTQGESGSMLTRQSLQSTNASSNTTLHLVEKAKEKAAFRCSVANPHSPQPGTVAEQQEAASTVVVGQHSAMNQAITPSYKQQPVAVFSVGGYFRGHLEHRGEVPVISTGVRGRGQAGGTRAASPQGARTAAGLGGSGAQGPTEPGERNPTPNLFESLPRQGEN